MNIDRVREEKEMKLNLIKDLSTEKDPTNICVSHQNKILNSWRFNPPLEWMEHLDNIESELENIDKKIGSDTFYPPAGEVFNALHLCPLQDVKVVIVGQDPYHNPGSAHGLSFSVRNGHKINPSLMNIFKELKRSIEGFEIPKSGNLEKWAKQGVLLLNKELTVKQGSPKSHTGYWSSILKRIIQAVLQVNRSAIFVLWGSDAQALKKETRFFKPTNLLECGHPSPMNRNRDFYKYDKETKQESGCGHFARINEILEEMGSAKIDWTL